MEKEFIPYTLALALKELGFDEPCFGSYVKLTETQNTFFMNDVVSEIDRETPLHKSLITKAPLYQQAFRWFGEKYNLDSHIHLYETHNGSKNDIYYEKKYYRYYIRKSFRSPFRLESENYKTYEEAELECLKKLIEICKKN